MQGYPEDEARDLLDKGCGAVLRDRRESALALITQALKFLEWQVCVCVLWVQWCACVGACVCVSVLCTCMLCVCVLANECAI